MVDSSVPLVNITRRAAIYEELMATDGWKEWLRTADKFKQELTADLIAGALSDTRHPAVSDDNLRAMIYMTTRLAALPLEAKLAFDHMRAQQDRLAAARDKWEKYADGSN